MAQANSVLTQATKTLDNYGRHSDLKLGAMYVMTATHPGVGVTKALFVNFSVSKIFDFAKVPGRFFESHSYLAGVTAAELRRHLPNINMIFDT